MFNRLEHKLGFSFYLVTLFVFGGFFSWLFLTGRISTKLFTVLTVFIPPIISVTGKIFSERIRKPDIRFDDKVKYSVAPATIDSFKGDDSARTVTPTVFFKLGVENKGNRTAKNCKITVKVAENGDHIARWAIPENPEELDLDPGQSESVHLFKATVLSDFINIVYNTETSKMIWHGQGEKVGLEPGYPKPPEAIKWNNVHPSVLKPRRMPPEFKDKSSFGGWTGRETGYNMCTISVQATARDYKSQQRDNFKTVQLAKKTVAVCANKNNWQDQWKELFDKSEEVIERTAAACRKRLDKIDEHPF